MKLPLPAFATAVLFTALCMGALGMFVLLPIACIQWTWNSAMGSFRVLPVINGWQATLLYLAMATTLFLTGVVRIEFETENSNDVP
jgi:hypothetical protein